MRGDGEVMTSGCKEHNLGRRRDLTASGNAGGVLGRTAADGDLAAVGFRNSVRAEIHPDLQGDRVGVGFGAAATPAPAGDIRSRSRSRSNGCARWSCCHTWLSRKSRRHDPARAVPSTGAEQPEPTRADAKRPSLGDAGTPPTTACSLVCVLLAARGLLLFLRLCWCGGRLRGAKRFRSLGRHLLLRWLRGLLSMPVLRGRRSAVNGWNAQADPPLPRFEAARTLLLMRARAAAWHPLRAQVRRARSGDTGRRLWGDASLLSSTRSFGEGQVRQ
jgi:hypothetical protein